MFWKTKTCLRTGLIVTTAAVGLGAGILLIVAVVCLDHLPPDHLCRQQGYSQWDCDSANQTLFDWVYDISCVEKTSSYNCLTAPPPCCLGTLDINASWRVPLMPQVALGYSLVNLNQVSCHNYARSVRAGVKKCGRPPPCPFVNRTFAISNSVLDDFEKTAYHSCVQERLEAGYFFLYFTGPVLLVSCLLLGYAAWQTTKPNEPNNLTMRMGTIGDRGGGGPSSRVSSSTSSSSRTLPAALWNVWGQEPMGKFGIFFGTVAAAILLEGIDVLLGLKHKLGWEGAIPCMGKSNAFVMQGSYFNTFHCYDVTIGGTAAMDPDYVWVARNVTLFIVGSVTGFLVIMVYVGLLIATCNCTKGSSQEEPTSPENMYDQPARSLLPGSVESDRSRRAKLRLVS